MAEKAKHAFGALEKIDQALTNGIIDAYDILFVKDANGKPYVGWIDKEGKKVIVDDSAEFAELESQIATKISANEVDAKIATKANVEDITHLESEVADKANAEEVDAKYRAIKYEISHKPEGTLVDYRDKEIRVLCPANTKWVKQNVGGTGNANMYYMGFKAYAPEGAVSFKEGDRGVIVDEIFDFNGDFAGTDEFGRNYSICWLALASYDEASNTWSYFGKNSTSDKYIGWTYVVEWYDANGVVIASDCIRINLSNENCHSAIKPFYGVSETEEIETKVEEAVEEKMTVKVEEAVNTANAYTDAQIEAKIAEIGTVEVVEF